MSEIIYHEVSGAIISKIFGCSFKNISAQMGFNDQPIVLTLTVVEEDDQDFTLDMNDVRSVQSVSFGELGILGIVQSWEKTTIDPNGTGIYNVRITDCRSVLDTVTMVNFHDPSGAILDVDIFNPLDNVIYVVGPPPGDDGEIVKEVPFSTIINEVESATLKYGNDVFRVNMNALKGLTNWRGEGIRQYYVDIEIKSLISTITEFCNAVGAEWWVESRRRSVTDDTIIIEIKVVRRLDIRGNQNELDMDSLAALHGGKVIRRKDGFENNNATTNKVIWGGIKRKLHELYNYDIKPFWGLDSAGEPLASPAYTLLNDPQSNYIDTTIEEMENALNGSLDGEMDADRLTALKQYIDTFWGKRFYYASNKNDMSTVARQAYEYIAFYESEESIIIRAHTLAEAREFADNFASGFLTIESREDRLPDAEMHDITDSESDLLNYPKITTVGWWESDIPPQGGNQFEPDILRRLTTGDGRWGSFARLPDSMLVGEGTDESPYIPKFLTWTPTVQNSTNLIHRENETYMRCTLEQYGRHIIIVMPVALTRYSFDSETGEFNSQWATRHDELTKAWIPIMDRNLHYGPWSSTSLVESSVPLQGKSEISVDKDLVPWTFNVRDMINSVAMAQLLELAAQKVDTLPKLAIINTGQLEVAGIPEVNIGQAVGLGGSITEIFIRFDANGVTTRYSMNLYTRELGEFKRKEEEIPEEEEEEEELPDFDDVAEEELSDLKPEGGPGVIIRTSVGSGPFYEVRKIQAGDIDPQFGGPIIPLVEWTRVRNFAEDDDSPGYLPDGTRVDVKIWEDPENQGPDVQVIFGPYYPYFEQAPQTFAPPTVTVNPDGTVTINP